MANNLALGLVIGGAVSSTVGTAFKDVESRIKKLGEQGTKARVLQSTIGDTMRLGMNGKRPTTPVHPPQTAYETNLRPTSTP